MNKKDGTIPFLDTVIRKIGEGVKFSVYRKPTNKDDFIHYLSAHNDRTKSGVVIGFFLRAYRICSKEFLDDEIRYVINSFKMLRYPEGFLIKMKNKALYIIRRKQNVNINTNNSNDDTRYISVPNSRRGYILDKHLGKAGLKIAASSGRKIGELVRVRKENCSNDSSVVYSIPCNGCSKIYI